MFKLKILKYLEKGDSLGLLSVLRKEGLGHGTLTQLHQLVTRELSSERFFRVQVVVQALDKLCENSKDLRTLLTSGLISKLLWWYECVFDKLTCDLSHSTALNNLTEAFFDYFLELAKPSVPVNELRVILMYLCRTALDPTVTFRLRLEAIRTFNCSLESSSSDQRRGLQAHYDIKCILSDMAAALFTAGDYELQASIIETLCRLTFKVDRSVRAKEWFVPELSLAFTAIRNPYFEADCRHFLNFLNSTQGDQQRVYTFPCLQAFLDSTQLRQPKDEDVREFWIDFNLGSESISFFLDNPNKETCFLWETIHVLRTEVNRYSLAEVNGVAVLHMDLTRPMFVEELRGQMLEIRFKADLLGQLSHVICRIFKKPSVPVSFMRTYRKKPPKRKLRVLPLSSPSSEGNSAVKSPERSRAEYLFDQIQHSTPVYKCGVHGDEQRHSCSHTSAVDLAGSVRKRPFSDSGYLSDTTRITPKRVPPSTERVRPPAQWRAAKEEEAVDGRMKLRVTGSVGDDAEEERVDERMELGAEEHVDGRVELGAVEERVDGRVELGAEEEHVDVNVGLDTEGDSLIVDVLAEEVGPEVEGAQSRAEGARAVAQKEAESVSEGPDTVARGGRSVLDTTGCLAEGPSVEEAESHVNDKESVAEVEFVIELEPATLKMGYLSDTTRITPKRVPPSTERVRPPAQWRAAKEEEAVDGRMKLRVDGSVGDDAEEERVNERMELGAEEHVDGRVELGAEEEHMDGRVEFGAEEEHVDVNVGLDTEGDSLILDVLAEEVGPEVEGAQSRAEGARAVAQKEAESVSEGPDTVARGGRSVVDTTGCLAEGPYVEEAESHVNDKESVAEVEFVIELEPATLKMEWSAGGAHLPEQVDLQVINSTESLVFEQSEELRANTDTIANLKSLFEQQTTSQWQQVENQVVQFQSETHKRLSEVLLAFEERRAVHAQMLQGTVWNWKALEDFHSIGSGITSFMKAENQRVTSFCQQQILKLKTCAAMERVCKKGGSSTVQK